LDETLLYKFMSRHHYAVECSTPASGAPQSALVGFAVTPNLEIIFDTVKTSRKYANLIARPSCSFVVGWEGEQTVQFEGIAEELFGPRLLECQEIYFSAWSDGPTRQEWPGIAYFVVKPYWIRFSDYHQNPPLIREFTI
jgi:hypothetical protein